MSALRRHAWLRGLLQTMGQLGIAGAIYATAAVAWRALGGRGTPGVVTVLAVTAMVAAALPLSRRPLERLVNWLAYGERVDEYELASGFLRRLETAVDLDDVLPMLAETVARTVGGRRGEVRVWMADGTSWRQTWPFDSHHDDADVSVPVRHGGDAVGEMVVSAPEGELSPTDRRLLGDLAGPAGVALSTLRLTHALRQQAEQITRTAEEIRASQVRIVGARRNEQVRIRKRIETRIKPHLDAALDRLSGIPTRAESGEDDLNSAAVEVGKALEELRTLARGLFPSSLAQSGPVEALRGWVEQNPSRRSLSVSGEQEPLRAQPDLAATLYFCAMTALPVSSSDGTVSIAVGEGEIRLEVDPPDAGAELDSDSRQALEDRVAAFGGEVVGGQAGSATIRVRLPLVGDLGS